MTVMAGCEQQGFPASLIISNLPSQGAELSEIAFVTLLTGVKKITARQGGGGGKGGTGWRLEFTFQPYRPATPLPGQQQTQVQVLLCPTWTGQVNRLLTLADQSKALAGCESQQVVSHLVAPQFRSHLFRQMAPLSS